ncbi:MAG: hypothetical protein IPO13_01040 [Rhodocyclaceae bacterium]|nr:hypothetical protein [Rhodocyclaceae bacterium]
MTCISRHAIGSVGAGETVSFALSAQFQDLRRRLVRVNATLQQTINDGFQETPPIGSSGHGDTPSVNLAKNLGPNSIICDALALLANSSFAAEAGGDQCPLSGNPTAIVADLVVGPLNVPAFG